MNFGPSYFKAVSLHTSRVVYCRQFGNARHMRHIAEAAPSWWDWKTARGRR